MSMVGCRGAAAVAAVVAAAAATCGSSCCYRRLHLRHVVYRRAGKRRPLANRLRNLGHVVSVADVARNVCDEISNDKNIHNM